MSMDPSGTNRIIQQQIKEWHAFREGERAAKLLGDASRPPPRTALGRGRCSAGRRCAGLAARDASRPPAQATGLNDLRTSPRETGPPLEALPRLWRGVRRRLSRSFGRCGSCPLTFQPASQPGVSAQRARSAGQDDRRDRRGIRAAPGRREAGSLEVGHLPARPARGKSRPGCPNRPTLEIGRDPPPARAGIRTQPRPHLLHPSPGAHVSRLNGRPLPVRAGAGPNNRAVSATA